MYLYWDEFLSLCVIVTLGAISPGPDWAVVAKNALACRKSGLASALGVSLGICLHMLYCLFGISALIQASPYLFGAVKVLGAFYLCYLGYKTARDPLTPSKVDETKVEGDFSKAFWQGFWTNTLNPKAVVFFISLFSLLIDPGTPIWILMLYAFTTVLIHLVWFSFTALLFSFSKVRGPLLTFQTAVAKVLGFALIGLGLFLLFYD